MSCPFLCETFQHYYSSVLAASSFVDSVAVSSDFAVAFLAVQCLLNAALDLITVFFINAPFVGANIQTDAGNMAAATGIPGIVWVVIWMGISLLMISFGLRLYAVSQSKKAANDSVFESDPAG